MTRDQLLNPAASRGTTLLTNVLVRKRRSLGGTWRAIVDPYDTGYINILGERDGRGWFRDFAPRSPSDRVEYDFDRSLEMTVPGDWNTQHDASSRCRWSSYGTPGSRWTFREAGRRGPPSMPRVDSVGVRQGCKR